MPTYIYECRPCGSVFSVKRPVGERDLPVSCPKCSTESSKRLFTTPMLLRRKNQPDPLSNKARRDSRTSADDDRGNVFINCSAEGNARSGFSFRGGKHVMLNTHVINNAVGIEVSDDAEVTDYNTTIE